MRISHLLTNIADTDVTVGSLTCFGAILSLSPPIRGVEVWLKNSTSSGEWPWIVKHCVDLIQTKGSEQCLLMIIKLNMICFLVNVCIVSNRYSPVIADGGYTSPECYYQVLFPCCSVR